MRLNRYIAHCGVASRRKADEFIAAGKVRVNGKPVTDFSMQVNEQDSVEVFGQRIKLPEQKTILALYKPRGVVSTVRDRHAETTVIDILPQKYKQLKPVGRLDKESEGLLLLTNDGELHQELTHPSFEHEKEYYIELAHPISNTHLQQLQTGIVLEEGLAKAKQVQRQGKRSLSMVLTQGKKRQIRRMVEALGNSVTLLRRVRIEALQLDDMQPGEVREITKEQILHD